MARNRPGVTGDNLLQILETRLDNVIYRLSMTETRQQARQFVNHGHLTVNGRRMDIPSYLVKPGDVVAWKRARSDSSTNPQFLQDIAEDLPKRTVPPWLRLDVANLTGEVASLPDVAEIDTTIDARLVVEFYSK